MNENNWMAKVPSLESLERLPSCCLKEYSKGLFDANIEAVRVFQSESGDGLHEALVEAARLNLGEKLRLPSICTHHLPKVVRKEK